MTNKLPSEFIFSGSKIAYSDLHRIFSSGEEGNKLSQSLRFIAHKPEGFSEKEWSKVLGADVNNLHHLIVTKGLTISFLKNLAASEKTADKEVDFTPEEQELLILTATVHDWAEAIVGDINYYLKTEQDHESEMAELKILIMKFFVKILDKNNKDKIEKLADQIIEILTHTNTKLGQAFNAIERVGYVRTGIRAFKESVKAKGETGQILQNMALRVVPGQVVALMDYATKFPPVQRYLEYHQNVIGDIFNSAKNSAICDSIPDFEVALLKWQEANKKAS